MSVRMKLLILAPLVAALVALNLPGPAAGLVLAAFRGRLPTDRP